MADAAMHAAHDPVDVAAALDRGAVIAPMLERCLRCAALYADLVTLAVALPSIGTPARPRDFTLSAADARRLGRRGWRGWWSAVGSARDTVTRPLAVGLTTLGIAGLVLTAGPTLLPSGGSAAISAEAGGDQVVRITAEPPASPAPVDGSSPVAGTRLPVAPWLGLLAVGGGLFAARRLAAHGRPVR